MKKNPIFLFPEQLVQFFSGLFRFRRGLTCGFPGWLKPIAEIRSRFIGYEFGLLLHALAGRRFGVKPAVQTTVQGHSARRAHFLPSDSAAGRRFKSTAMAIQFQPSSIHNPCQSLQDTYRRSGNQLIF